MLAPVEVEEPALWLHRGSAPPMHGFHRHDDLEINVVLEGGLRYLFGGRQVEVPAGRTAIFWAAAPHRLVPAVDAGRTDVCWIHIPLAVVLGWSLPGGSGGQVLSQHPVVVPTAVTGDQVVSRFEAWRQELGAGGNPDAVLLELNALLLRILSHATSSLSARPDLTPPPHLGRVALMARYIAEEFRSPISTADVAEAANLNPNYATILFRQSCGVTLGEQLLRHRVAEAQRLLVTTSMTTASVAHASGFGSVSSFYARFAQACGCSPGVYRATRAAAPRR